MLAFIPLNNILSSWYVLMYLQKKKQQQPIFTSLVDVFLFSYLTPQSIWDDQWYHPLAESFLPWWLNDFEPWILPSVNFWAPLSCCNHRLLLFPKNSSLSHCSSNTLVLGVIHSMVLCTTCLLMALESVSAVSPSSLSIWQYQHVHGHFRCIILKPELFILGEMQWGKSWVL